MNKEVSHLIQENGVPFPMTEDVLPNILIENGLCQTWGKRLYKLLNHVIIDLVKKDEF